MAGRRKGGRKPKKVETVATEVATEVAEVATEVASEVAEVAEEVATEVSEVAESPRKKGGRKPMTEAEKKVAAKKRAEEIEAAKNLKPTVILQYQGRNLDIQQITENTKIAFKSVKKRTRITDLKVYVKPEENAAYYVVNGDFDGKIDL